MLPYDEEHMRILKEYYGLSELEYKTKSKNGEGIFYMFIKKKQKIEKIEKISGIIKERISSYYSAFIGMLSDDFIEFLKKHSKKAKKTIIVPENDIFYKAQKTAQYKFTGTYYIPANEINPAWKGKFRLLKYPEAPLRKISSSLN